MSRFPNNSPPGTPSNGNGGGEQQTRGGAGGGGGPLAPGYAASPAKLAELRERRRLRRIFRAINNGDWRRVLITLQKTQHTFRPMIAHGERVNDLLAKCNLVRLAWRIHADVLVGTEPLVTTQEGYDEQWEALERLKRRVLLHSQLHSAARKAAVEAECALRVDTLDGAAVVTIDENDTAYPVGPDGPDLQPTVWERRWIVERADSTSRDGKRRYLRVERHRAPGGVGVVEQEAYETESLETLQDLTTLRRVPLAAAFLPGETPPPDSTPTGAPYPLLTRIVTDYYDGAPEWPLSEHDVDLLDTVAAAFTRLVRSHALHAEPKLRVSSSMLDTQTGMVRMDHDAVIDDDKVAEYLRAEFDIGRMLEVLDRMLGLLLVMLQVSQALLGYKMGGGATPDSYDKLRLEATNTLAHARRFALYFGPALARTLTVASTVEARMPGRGWPVAPVTVEMRPQIPKDPLDLAREMREMLEGETPLIDQRSALARLHGEGNADEMMAAIAADQDARAARNRLQLMGEPE
ncbi:MAG: hypothetical protein BroJett004_08010 [Planctomycetota bacterium]|nr:MAG: hypothetical protein BroJett004_08010 [Planctomycetota bacterium]